MPRTKKETIPCSFRLSAAVVRCLETFCLDSGQSKTVAVERALMMYFDDYDKKQRKLDNKE